MKPKHWELNILLADDSDTEIELFQMALRKCGQVRSLNVVRDGSEAIAYLRGDPPFTPNGRQAPNIIVLDLKMPRVGGLDVLDWLKHHPECSVIPTVIFSNSMEPKDVERAYQLGANAFFAKPGKFKELEEILELILRFWERAVRPEVKKPICR